MNKQNDVIYNLLLGSFFCMILNELKKQEMIKLIRAGELTISGKDDRIILSYEDIKGDDTEFIDSTEWKIPDSDICFN